MAIKALSAIYERANSQRHVENLMRGTSASASVYYSRRQKGSMKLEGARQCNAVAASDAKIGYLKSVHADRFPGSILFGHYVEQCKGPLISSHAIAIMFILAPVNCNNQSLEEATKEWERGEQLRRCIKGMRWLERMEGEMQRVGVIVLNSRYRI